MMRFTLALLLCSLPLQAAEAPQQLLLAREGAWTAGVLTMANSRLVCVAGTGEIDNGLWLKAQMQKSEVLGYLELRKTSWKQAPNGQLTIRFSDGEQLATPYRSMENALLVVYQDRWADFSRTMARMVASTAAIITLTDKQDDPMRVTLRMPPRVNAAFENCIKERLLVAL